MIARVLWAGAAAVCFLASFGAVYQYHDIAAAFWWVLGSLLFVLGTLKPRD